MKVLNIKLSSGKYDITIKPGILSSVGNHLIKICNSNRVVVITDTNVYNLYYAILEKSLRLEGFEIDKIVLEPGEKSKSVQVLLSIYDKLVQLKANRSTTIIALGGGVVGDITGFAASTFLRGMPFIQIPTTLLAQVDSSIGGKVAVNHTEGKNLIGSFYHPKAVYIDPELLSSLDNRVFNDGLSEVIKYGVIRDRDLFSQLLMYSGREELMGNMEEIIYKCCNIKKQVVEVDEKDIGERMILNFGHTIGHAIEKYYNYEKFTHGEAVAIGMYKITEISEALKLTNGGTLDSLRQLLNKYNLSFQLQNLDEDTILDAIKLDKKNIGDGMFVILLKSIGEGYIHKLEDKNIKTFFRR